MRCEYKNADQLEGKVRADHIHMMLTIPPTPPTKYSVSGVAGDLELMRTIMVFEQYTLLQHNIPGHSFLARGYYVNTVGFNESDIRENFQNLEENEWLDDSAKLDETVNSI